MCVCVHVEDKVSRVRSSSWSIKRLGKITILKIPSEEKQQDVHQKKEEYRLIEVAS